MREFRQKSFLKHIKMVAPEPVSQRHAVSLTGGMKGDNHKGKVWQEEITPGQNLVRSTSDKNGAGRRNEAATRKNWKTLDS